MPVYTISQHRMREAYELQERKRELEKKAREIGKELDALRVSIEEHRDSIQPGRYTVKEKESTVRVSWKEEFISHVSEETALRIMANQPKKTQIEIVCR